MNHIQGHLGVIDGFMRLDVFIILLYPSHNIKQTVGYVAIVCIEVVGACIVVIFDGIHVSQLFIHIDVFNGGKKHRSVFIAVIAIRINSASFFEKINKILGNIQGFEVDGGLERLTIDVLKYDTQLIIIFIN
jgi:hypothetical protein